MTPDLKHILGQLFITGLPGKQMDEHSLHLIREYNIGGFILFKKNIESLEQVRALNRELQMVALEHQPAHPLFLSIDQEWGIVNRFPAETITQIQGPMALGALENQSDSTCQRVGKFTGVLLRNLGFNLNFAPCLDLATTPENPQLGTRAFHEEVSEVLRRADSIAEGMYEQGVFPCLKHFPGLADAKIDTHFGRATVDLSYLHLVQQDMAPFARYIARQCIDFVMVSHALFPQLDSQGLPASLSPAIIGGILRKTLNYQGVVVTDDLNMGAISEYFDLKDACLLALQAGADLLLVCMTPQEVPGLIDYLAEKVESGELSMDLVTAAYERIQERKSLLLSGENTASETDLHSLRQDAKQLAERIARDSVTIAYQYESYRHLKAEADRPVRVLVPSRHWRPESNFDFACSPFVERLAEISPLSGVAAYGGTMTERDYLDLVMWAKAAVSLVIVTHNTHLYPAERSFLEMLAGNTPRKVYASLGAAFDLDILPAADMAVAAYSTSPASQIMAAEVITGHRQATGRLPVTLYRFHSDGGRVL